MKTIIVLILSFLLPIGIIIAQSDTTYIFELSIHSEFKPKYDYSIAYLDNRCIINGIDYYIVESDSNLVMYLERLEGLFRKYTFRSLGSYSYNKNGAIIGYWTGGTIMQGKVIIDGETRIFDFHSGNIDHDYLQTEILHTFFNIMFYIADSKRYFDYFTNYDRYNIERMEYLSTRSAIRKVSDKPLVYKLYDRVYDFNYNEVCRLFDGIPYDHSVIVELGRFFNIHICDKFDMKFKEDISQRDNIKWIVYENNKDYLISIGLKESKIYRVKEYLDKPRRCGQEAILPMNIDPEDMILYVEEDYGSYGDGHDVLCRSLILLNPDTGDKVVAIRDEHSINHPSWSPDGRIITFESNLMLFQSNIYTYNLYTGTYKRIDEGLALRYPDIIKRENNKSPVWSNSGNKIAFVNHDRLLVYSIELDTLILLAEAMLTKPRLRWSSDDKYIIHQQRYTKSVLEEDYFTYSIMLHGVDADTSIEIGEKGWIYANGYESNGDLYFIGTPSRVDIEYNAIYKYNLIESTISILYESKNMHISEIMVCNDHLYFIATTYCDGELYGKHHEDIYKMDLNNYTLEQITDDGRTKKDMDIYCIWE
jgi:hypothetical protein